MAMEVITPGHTGLALFTLLMCIGYVAMQISPTHICLILCSEDYKASLGSMIRKDNPDGCFIYTHRHWILWGTQHDGILRQPTFISLMYSRKDDQNVTLIFVFCCAILLLVAKPEKPRSYKAFADSGVK